MMMAHMHRIQQTQRDVPSNREQGTSKAIKEDKPLDLSRKSVYYIWRIVQT